MKICSIAALKKSYNHQLVLDIDELTLEPGEVLAITGPNGSGKSTLLRLLCLLEEPDEAEVFRLFGTDTASADPLSLRRRIGLVVQQPFMFHGSVFDNIALGLRWRKFPDDEVRNRVEHYARMLEIDYLDRVALEVSRGQAQRIALARALALDPELLLLDEPLSAMDANIRTRLLTDLVLVLAAPNRATILVTHSAEETDRLATKQLQLVDGKIEPYR